MTPWWLWIVAAAWVAGWFAWVFEERPQDEFDAVFALTFGVFFWPLLMGAKALVRLSQRLPR